MQEGSHSDGFSVILLDTFAIDVPPPEGGLRIRVAGLGAVSQVGDFLCC